MLPRWAILLIVLAACAAVALAVTLPLTVFKKSSNAKPKAPAAGASDTTTTTDTPATTETTTYTLEKVAFDVLVLAGGDAAHNSEAKAPTNEDYKLINASQLVIGGGAAPSEDATARAGSSAEVDSWTLIDAPGASMLVPWAKAMRTLAPPPTDPTRKLLLIDACWSGSVISDWSPGGKAYTRILDALKLALTTHDDTRIFGLAWVHSEADAGDTNESYGLTMKAMLDGLQAEVGALPSVSVLTPTMPSVNRSGQQGQYFVTDRAIAYDMTASSAPMVQADLEELAVTVPNAVYVATFNILSGTPEPVTNLVVGAHEVVTDTFVTSGSWTPPLGHITHFSFLVTFGEGSTAQHDVQYSGLYGQGDVTSLDGGVLSPGTSLTLTVTTHNGDAAAADVTEPFTFNP